MQGCPTGGPRAPSGPRPLLIRPATTLQRTLFTDLCFSAIFCLLCVVNKLKICWTQPVVCKYSTPAVDKHSGNQSFIFKNARSSYWRSVPVGPNFYGIWVKMLIPFDRYIYLIALQPYRWKFLDKMKLSGILVIFLSKFLRKTTYLGIWTPFWGS